MLRTCRVCGKEYESSYACDKRKSWKALACCQEHYSLLITVMDYLTDHDAEKAYHVLLGRGFDFNDIDGYLPSVQDTLIEIFDRAGTTGPAEHLFDLAVGAAESEEDGL